MSAFALTPRIWDGAWWQLWSCHAAHWDAAHAALNVVAALPPLLLAGWKRTLRELLPWAAAAAPVLTLALLASGYAGEYRGASGLVAGAWAFVAVASLRAGNMRIALITGSFLAVKILFELCGVRPSTSDSYQTVSFVHYAGVLSGASGAWLWRFRCS